MPMLIILISLFMHVVTFHKMKAQFVTLGVLALMCSSCVELIWGQSLASGSYKAAVYEHPVVYSEKRAESYEQALKYMMVNLHEYKRQADIAGGQNLDIIVFPEVGIYGHKFHEPSEIAPYLEYIPDPQEIDWVPCENPDKFQKTKVQTFLSCLAKNNSFYLVANYGDAQPCTSTDPNCPASGQYQYNTNIVYNREGKLIARYHKQHLFFENHFQEPAVAERIVFDTEFGRFGTFVCFDILFYDPAIPLVQDLGITDVVFPTAWMDALPYFSAIGYHSSYAAAYNVNFLASNIHNPSSRFQGSGIYTPNGAVTYYYDSESPDGRLLVHDVPIRNRTSNKFQGRNFTFGSDELRFLKNHDFTANVFHDSYNFVSLDSLKGKITVCMDDHCCFLAYERDQIIGNYAFGVFNGMHTYEGEYYLQICILLKCASQNNEDCGQVIHVADGYFNFFNIKGNFSTPYVTPQLVTSDNGSLRLSPQYRMQFDTNGLTGEANDVPLLETALIGRIYSPAQTAPNMSPSHFTRNQFIILMLSMMVLQL